MLTVCGIASTAACGPISRSSHDNRSTKTTAQSSTTTHHPHSIVKCKTTKTVIADRFEHVNGSWVRNTWSLYGRTGPITAQKIHSTSTASPTTTILPSLVQDNLGRFTATVTSSTAAATASRSANAANNHAAEASQTSIAVPAGWKAPTRATKLYAVPVIITISVLVALSLVGTIVGSVIWRKRKRTRRQGRRLRDNSNTNEKTEKGVRAAARRAVGRVRRPKRGGDEAPAEGGEDGDERAGGGQLSRVVSGGSRRVASGIAVGSAGRLRERRRRRAERASLDGHSDEDDEARSRLTGRSGSIPDTLTARLSARMRNSIRRPSESPTTSMGPSTVFSGALERVDTQSTTGSPASLSRSISAYDDHSLRTVPSRSSANPSAELLDHQNSHVDQNSTNPLSTSALRRQSSSLGGPGLPLPATSPSLVGSSFGQFLSGVEAALPSFGPPAYRPKSTTIQATSRLTSSLLGRGARRHARRASVDEERAEPEALLWPEEKRQFKVRARIRASEAALASASAASGPLDEEEAVPEHAEHDEPEIDRNEYAAHLATDDKAVLARLRDYAQPNAGDPSAADAPTTSRIQIEASAPQLDEDEIDDDGFERLPLEIPTIVVDQPSLLPLPPQPILTASHTSFESPTVSHLPSRVPSPSPSASPSSVPLPSTNAHAGLSAVALGKRAEARQSAVDLADEVDEDEESFLPVYLPRAGVMASAPGGESDDEEDNEDGGAVVGMEEREEHAVI